jgi:hypothetical protein
MSYDLMVEGDLDLFELAQMASRYEPLELFPIPAEGSWPGLQRDHPGQGVKLAPDALGVAVVSGRSGPPAIAALRALVEYMWSKQASVFDLYTGTQITTAEDLGKLAERASG